MAKKLEQTRGTFKLKGLVKGIDRDNAYEEGVRNGGRFDGRTFRKINLQLQTMPNNQLRLGIFSYKPDKVFAWNNDKKKKDKNYKGDRIPWETYLEQKEILRANGTAILQNRVGVTYDENDKLISEGMTNYEATEMIYDNIDNDDSVYVEGDVSFSEYQNRANETVVGTNYNISRFHKAGDDFDIKSEDYEKQNYYEQEMIFVDSMIDKENDRLIVIGRVIDYRENTVDTEFIVNYGNEDSMKKLAKNLNKKFKFGDFMKVFGEIKNEAIETEVEVEEDDALAMLGGKSQPSYAKRANVTYNREMTIDGVLEWERGMYTEEDFAQNELIEDEEDEKKEDLSDELGGKSKKKDDNPFSDDEDDDLSGDEDEVDPFSDDSDDISDDIPF